MKTVFAAVFVWLVFYNIAKADILGGVISTDDQDYEAYVSVAKTFFERVREPADCGFQKLVGENDNSVVAQCVFPEGSKFCTLGGLSGESICFHGPGVGRVTNAALSSAVVSASADRSKAKPGASLPLFSMQWTFVSDDYDRVFPPVLVIAMQLPDGGWRLVAAEKGGVSN